jgi:hypothetical protein
MAKNNAESAHADVYGKSIPVMEKAVQDSGDSLLEGVEVELRSIRDVNMAGKERKTDLK